MSKKIYLLSLFSLFLLLPHTSYADCTKEEIEHFKEIEDEYKVTYEFDENTQKYTVMLHSKDVRKYALIYQDYETMVNAEYYENGNELDFKIKNFNPGTYEFIIAGQTDTCKDILKRINVKLDKYNELSKNELCEGIEEFVLCQPTYDKEISYEEFVSRVNTYKKTKSKKETIDGNKNNNSIDKKISIVTDFIKANLQNIVIIAIFIIITIIAIILFAKSYKKSRRLEWLKENTLLY